MERSEIVKILVEIFTQSKPLRKFDRRMIYTLYHQAIQTHPELPRLRDLSDKQIRDLIDELENQIKHQTNV